MVEEEIKRDKSEVKKEKKHQSHKLMKKHIFNEERYSL